MPEDCKFPERLQKLRGTRTVIVGIGNILKGDDAAGPLICQRVKEARICAEVIDVGTVPENYIQVIVNKAPENLLLIDALDFQAEPGTIELFDPACLSSFAFSTHTLSPTLFLELISKQINVEILFLGIQPGRTDFAGSPGPPVQEAISKVTDILVTTFSGKEGT